MDFAGKILILLGVLVFAACMLCMLNPKWAKNPKSGVIPKRLHLLLSGTMLPLILFIAGGSMMDAPAKPAEQAQVAVSTSVDNEQSPAAHEAALEPMPNSQPVKAKVTKNLGMTPEDFRKAYNDMVGQVDKSWRVAEFEVGKGDVHDAFNAQLGKAAHVVGGVDKVNGKLIDLMVVVGGGQPEDNLQAITAMLSVAQVATQGAAKEKISNAVSTNMQKAMADIDNAGAKPIKVRVGNREYSFVASKFTGLMFSISDAGK